MTGARKAIGRVTGTDASRSIEKLIGIFNNQKGVSPAKCPPGEPGVFVKFDPNTPMEDQEDSTDSSDDPEASQKDQGAKQD